MAVADSSVLLEVIVQGKNIKVVERSLDKLTTSTDKAAKSQEKLNKAANAYNKGEKGVASAGANSTKNFSKMRTVIGGGSSGLVAAYATLAANLFAATAAFNSLRNASKVDDLVKGLSILGTRSGRDLEGLANQIIEVTGNAVSMQQALRTAAVAASAGFDSDTVLKLGKVAKGASIALDRDLGDALDRLIRGVAKLEPEILDELGIFVRLDDAVDKYSTQLGKAASDLTEFERRQAFTNDALTKGLERFEEVADALDANAYDQLAASFQNLAKEISTAASTLLIPTIGFLTNNLSALAGVGLFLGQSVARNVAGSFVTGAEGVATYAGELKEASDNQLKNLEATEKLPNAYKKVRNAILQGNAGLTDYRKGIDSLEASLTRHNGDLREMSNGTQFATVTLRDKVNSIEGVNTTLANLRQNLITTTSAQANLQKATALAAVSQGQYVQGIVAGIGAIKTYATGLREATKGAGLFAASLATVRIALFGIGVVIGLTIQIVLGLVAVIGLLIAFGPQILDWIENKFFPERVLEKKIRKIEESLDIIRETALDFTKKFKDNDKKVEESINRAANNIKTASGVIADAYKVDIKASEDRAAKIKAAEEAVQAQREENATQAPLEKLFGIEATASARQVKKLQELQTELANLKATEEDYAVSRAASISAAEKAVKDFYSTIDDPGIQAVVNQDDITSIELALNTLKRTGDITNLVDALGSAQTKLDNLSSAFATLRGETQNLADQRNDLLKVKATPYDTILNTYKKINEQAKFLSENTAASLANGLSQADVEKNIAAYLKQSGFEKREDLVKEIQLLEKQLILYRTLPKQIKAQEQVVKRLNRFKGEDIEFLRESLKQRRELLRLQKLEVQNEIRIIEGQAKKAQLSEGQAERLIQLRQQLVTLGDRQVDLAVDERETQLQIVRDLQKQVTLRQKIAGQQRSSMETQLELAKVNREIYLLRTGRDEESAKLQLETFKREKALRIAIIQSEMQSKITSIMLEYALLYAQNKLNQDRAKIVGVELDNAKIIEDLIIKGAKESVKAAKDEYDLAIARLEREEALLEKKVRDEGGTSRAILGDEDFTKKLEEYRAKLKTASEEITAEIMKVFDKIDQNNLKNGGIFGQIFGNIQEFLPLIKASIEALRVALQPMVDIFKSLGPEGQLLASVTEGVFVFADSLGTIIDKDADLSSKLMATANILGAMGNIASAASDQRVAAIDKEIEAERKRDGKSKESQKKIAQLEAKKDAEKKKAFEINKKISMAQTAIATTVAAMEAWKSMSGIPFVGPALGAAAAAAITAMGMKAVSMIASTSYQGGSSSGGVSGGASQVEMGSRTSSVDLATSRSASGELGYLRGESGVGGAENFRPGAFMGAKYRKDGGPTAGYIVGEQGPELFVPSSSGEIISNDKMGMSSTQNVNISISAIDAAGVEEVLIAQRGNIIGMIREAANNIGEEFYEDIDTTVYSSSVGATKY